MESLNPPAGSSRVWPPLIAVAGSSEPTDQQARIAFRTGELLAEAKVIVVCGGLGGVMDAVARGVAAKQGISVGLLPHDDLDEASRSLSIPIATGLGQGRNIVLAHSCQSMIAIGGGYGTLAEIAFALRIGKPVATIDSWTFQQQETAPSTDSLYLAESPEDAISWILARLQVA